jgi:hypothetical protein
MLNRSFASRPITRIGKLTTTNASNAGHLCAANNPLCITNTQPAGRRVLFFDSGHGGEDNGKRSLSIMPNTPNSPSGGIPGNSHHRKKEIKKFKAMLLKLGIPIPAGNNAQPEEHHASHTNIGNAISSLGVAVAIILYLFNRTPTTTWVALGILLASLVYPTLAIAGYWKKKTWTKLVLALAADVVIMAGIAWYAWPSRRS